MELLPASFSLDNLDGRVQKLQSIKYCIFLYHHNKMDSLMDSMKIECCILWKITWRFTEEI